MQQIDQVKKILENYLSNDAQQLLCRQQMLDLLESGSNCFFRSHRPGHFTASGWLIDRTGTKALLMHHAKLGIWVQPGGHCDGNIDLLQVAINEAKEESGINHIEPVNEAIFDLDVHEIPSIGSDTAHYHYDIRFLLQVKSDENFIMNNESKELRWFDHNVESLPTNEHSVLRMFHKWKKIKLNTENCSVTLA